MAAYPLIDIYCHIYPEKFFQEMTKVSPQTENLGKRLRTITKLFDLGERFREMDCFGDYRQIPDRKTDGSATVAAIAVAPMTPMPGMVSSRLLASFERCCAMIRFSINPITVCTA